MQRMTKHPETRDASVGECPPLPLDRSGLSNDTTFSFHPPSLADISTVSREQTLGSYSSDGSGSDDDAFGGGGGGAGAARPPPTPSTAGGAPATGTEYEYGSESRPQSRRLSVMELCNDPATADAPVARPFSFPYQVHQSPPHLTGSHLQALTRQQQQMPQECLAAAMNPSRS